MNLIELNKKLELFTEQLYTKPNVQNGDIYVNLNTSELKYPVVNIDSNVVQVNSEDVVYSFYIYYADRLTESCDNRNAIQEDAIKTLQLIINAIRDHEELSIEMPATINLFEQKFADVCAGAFVQINIHTKDSVDYCNDIPNLGNIIINENGNYNVTNYDKAIVNVNSGSGSSKWGDIEGNINDQIDIQNVEAKIYKPKYVVGKGIPFNPNRLAKSKNIRYISKINSNIEQIPVTTFVFNKDEENLFNNVVNILQNYAVNHKWKETYDNRGEQGEITQWRIQCWDLGWKEIVDDPEIEKGYIMHYPSENNCNMTYLDVNEVFAQEVNWEQFFEDWGGSFIHPANNLCEDTTTPDVKIEYGNVICTRPTLLTITTWENGINSRPLIYSGSVEIPVYKNWLFSKININKRNYKWYVKKSTSKLHNDNQILKSFKKIMKTAYDSNILQHCYWFELHRKVKQRYISIIGEKYRVGGAKYHPFVTKV